MSRRERIKDFASVPYSSRFNDHIENPRNAGELPDANAIAEETNPVCGDSLRLSLRLEKGRIEAVGFLAYGCAPTLACGSALTELLKGETVVNALLLTRKDVVDAVGGLPSRKTHAAALAIETLRCALSSSGRRAGYPGGSPAEVLARLPNVKIT